MKYAWLDKDEYPFNSHYLDVNGHQLHYIDEGEGEILLFVHGTPSWSFDFRNVIKLLKNEYRCIAIDHIGFGLSDKPEVYDYSTQNHSKTLEYFIQSKSLKDINLVIHDFGGPIGFDYAIQNPENINKIAVLNSWLWSSRSEPEFVKLSRILKSPLLPFLYRYFNFSARFILPNSFGDQKISKKIHRQFLKPFSNRKERNGTLAFAYSLLNDQDWFGQLWKRTDSIKHKPILFIWGMKDKLIGKKYLDKFLNKFTNSSSNCIEAAGHFPQEEAPEIVAKAIQSHMSRH